MTENNSSPINNISSAGAGQDAVANAKNFLETVGEVLELKPGATFVVRLENGHEIFCHLSGKMRLNKIKLLPGDRVKIEMSPYDLTKGRITYRL